jgi:hypothetical protein
VHLERLQKKLLEILETSFQMSLLVDYNFKFSKEEANNCEVYVIPKCEFGLAKLDHG